jgi:hypothetical protein
MSANWRKAQAKRYAYDARNAEAAQCLRARSGINIRENVWQHLEPLVANPACLRGTRLEGFLNGERDEGQRLRRDIPPRTKTSRVEK